MAKKKEEIKEGKDTSLVLTDGGFGGAILSLLKFVLPEITSGSIKVNDTYFDAKTGVTTVIAEACGADIECGFKFVDGTKRATVKVTTESSTRKFVYEEDSFHG